MGVTGGRATEADSGLLERPRLDAAIDRGATDRLTLLTAPAGYGKSVAVRLWAAAQGSPIGWVTLQPADDAQRMATKLLSAAETVGAIIGPAGSRPSLDSPVGFGERFLPGLLRLLASVGDIVLVLDDLDAPRDVQLTAQLGSMIEQAPRNVHIVATQRSRGVASWLRTMTRDVVNIGSDDLAFTRDEVRLLVRRVSSRELTEAQLDTLMSRTEGWPVGLHIAAVAMRGPAEPDDVIEAVRGEDRHVAGFLRTEVLDALSTDARQFLAQASVLERLSAPVCEEVIGMTGARSLLRMLDRRGAFVRRVTSDNEAYVLHPLLRDLLRDELQVTEPGLAAELLVRAATSYERRGELELAGACLVRAERWDELISFLDRAGRALFERGAAEATIGWLEAVPLVTPRRRCEVALREALLMSASGRSKRAEQLLRGVREHLSSPGERVIVDAIRATWVTMDASPASTIRAADEALAILDELDPQDIPNVLGMSTPDHLRMHAAGGRARARWYLGESVEARDEMRALAAEATYGPWRAHLLGSLALLEAWAGNLRVAEREARAALVVAMRTLAPRHPATLDAHLALAVVLRERNALLRADEHLNEARWTSIETRRLVGLDMYTLERARWYLSTGRPERGLATIASRAASGDPPPPPVVEHQLVATEVRLLLAIGDVDAAARVLARASRSVSVPCTAVQVAVAQHDVPAARAALDEWSVPDDAPHARLEHALWTAVVDLEEGRRGQALNGAARVVGEAEQLGEVRLLLDAGRPVDRLLRSLVHFAPSPYLERLVRCAQPWGPSGSHPARGLSERELEVVRYLPTSLSSVEIAGQLYISLNTLKTHLRTIYRKLGVSNRREAIERSEQLGIA